MVKASEIIKKCIRADDIVARIGGDEMSDMALQEIKINGGKQFDPKLVEVFIKVCKEHNHCFKIIN